MGRLRIRDGAGTVRTITRIKVRDDDATSRTIQRIRARDATGTLRTVWEAFTASVTPDTVSGYGNGGSSANITTGSTVASASGGTSPFTYAWSQVGATPYVWSIGSATAATTSFTVTALGAGVTANALFKVTITDAAGATSEAFVEAIANNGQPYEPPNRYIRADGTLP